MPIPFAPLVGFALGVLLAWIGAAEVGRSDGPLVTSRPFAIVLALALLVYAPILAYFVTFHGDWAYLYLVPWAKVPSALDLLLVCFGASTLIIGFAVAAPCVRKRRNGALAILVCLPAALVLALLAVSTQRLGASATYAQFHGQFGVQSLTVGPLGRGVLWMSLLLVLAVGWCARSLWQMSAEAKR